MYSKEIPVTIAFTSIKHNIHYVIPWIISSSMGKKFGVNTKAEEGRARKALAADEKKQQLAAKKALEEDKKWQEGSYKNKKKEDEEVKRLERLAKKKEREELEQRERAELETCKGNKSSSTKTETKKDRSIAVNVLRAAATELSASTLSSTSNLAVSPTSSINSGSIDVYSASNLDDALSLLESLTVEPATGSIERHPERRMKAAYAAFEEREMPELKAQNPGLRHSQLKEKLFRMWQKAPENPFNQAHIAHTATRQEEMQAIREHSEQGLERFRTTPPP